MNSGNDNPYRLFQFLRPEMPPGTFFKPKFFDFMEEEYRACFEGVGIIDMSSFSKIKITVRTFNFKAGI